MAPVHDFRHVEIDNIGRGKRVLKPPGGECSDIFNVSPPSLDHTPRRQRTYMQSTIFSPSDGVDGGTPSSSAKKGHNTQNRLFGPPEEGGTPKVVVDRQKSNIFSPADEGGRTNGSSTKKQARRNPITGEVDGGNSTPYTNGHSPGEAAVNGDSTPVRSGRIPPGGRCSGIF